MQVIQCNKCGKRYKARDSESSNEKLKYRCNECNNLIVVANPKVTAKADEPKDVVPYQSAQVVLMEDFSPTIIDQAATDENTSESNSRESIGTSLSLRTKFNLSICTVFLCAIVLIYFLTGSRLQKNAEEQVFNRARLLLTTMEASRSFTSKVVKPALYKAIPDRFITEGMSSSFGARNIFDSLRKTYPQYYFKHAAPFPRNLINKADEFEMSIINKFAEDPNLKEWQGYRTQNGGKEYYSIMKPIVAKQRCMRCHSDPALAPKDMLERYGNINGFGRSVGEIIGALTVSVPSSEVLDLDKARTNTIIFIGMVLLVFAVMTVIANIFFSKVVLKPIKSLADNADEISLGKLDTHINTVGNDEIAKLAKAFNRMKISIKMAFEQLAR